MNYKSPKKGLDIEQIILDAKDKAKDILDQYTPEIIKRSAPTMAKIREELERLTDEQLQKYLDYALSRKEEKKTFTADEIREYLTGWLLVGENRELNVEAVGAIKNALACLDCEQDGIEATREREKYYRERDLAFAHWIVDISKQKLSDEMEHSNDADFEGAYNQIVEEARNLIQNF